MGVPFLFVAALFAVNPVTLGVYPPFGMAPATFRALVRVPRHADNRRVCYGYDGPEFKQSCRQLDGANAAQTLTVYWSLRVAGEYEASVVLTRIEEGRQRDYRDVKAFRVIGMEDY